MKRGGATALRFDSVDEKARFATWMQANLDKWRYRTGRTWPELARELDIVDDQISKYLRAAAIPSKQTVEKMIQQGVLEESWADIDQLFHVRPWEDMEPDAGVLARARNQGKKPKPKPAEKKTPAPAPAPAPVVAVAADDIYDAIAALDVPARQKQILSALVALSLAGAELSIDVMSRVHVR